MIQIILTIVPRPGRRYSGQAARNLSLKAYEQEQAHHRAFTNRLPPR
jgi:hypothetical protein